MNVHKVRAGVLVTVTGLFLLGAGVGAAQATKPAPDHKVTLCHRTASAAGGNQHNGYDIITVDIASVANAMDVRGHDSHEQQGNGPGGDIIPSFTYEDFTYPGKNLGDGGQAFLDNGCNAPVVIPVKPEPVVVVTHSDKLDCVSTKVTTTTVTKTTGWILEGDEWVAGSPMIVEDVTTRPTTAKECPVVVPPVTVVVEPPVTVAGVEAVAPAVAPAVAVVNPVPAAASAGAADTSGQLVAGGLMGMAAFLAFGAAFASRRRYARVGEV